MGRASGWFRFPVRYHVVALVVMAVVAVLILAGTVVWTLGREQQRSVETGVRATAGALASAVEHEVADSVAALEALATSTALDRGDFRAVYEQAAYVQAAELSEVVGLTDARGQMLVSSLDPFGPPLPSIADRDDVLRVIRTGRPAVSDVVPAPITGRLTVTVAVPVHRDGVLRYIVFAALRRDALDRIVTAQQVPAGWIAGIADTRQVLIAGTRSPDGGVYAWQRTTSLGWTVTLAAPVSAVDVLLRRSMWWLTVGGLLVILTAGALAIVLDRRMSGAIGRYLSGTIALGRVSHALERAGETIAERTAALQSSQTKLKRLVESNLIGVVVREGDWITEANDAFLRMLGYSSEDLRDGKLRWRALTPHEYQAADDAARAEARQTGACSPNEKEYVRKDGTRVTVLVGRVLLDDARDEWVAFALDLTERKRLEAERVLRIEAQAADRAKDDFLAVVSHELRTPLGTIVNSVRALQRAGLGAPQAAAILDRIDRSARLQARLVGDLLNVSRIIAGKLQIDKQPVDVLPVVAAAVGALSAEAADKGVELRTALDAPPAPMLADPERLQEIVLNLIVNAIKFTPPGGRVDVSLESCDGRAVLTVRDTGRGIAPELIPHIFDRFRQGNAGQHGGLGLGLAIVRHLVEAHEGTVRAESPGPGGGAVFTVELPLHAGVGEAAVGGVA